VQGQHGCADPLTSGVFALSRVLKTAVGLLGGGRVGITGRLLRAGGAPAKRLAGGVPVLDRLRQPLDYVVRTQLDWLSRRHTLVCASTRRVWRQELRE
jgi:hypothetical protein